MSSKNVILQMTQYLSRKNGSDIAYKMLNGQNPGVIFCPGFQSNMQGEKASALEDYCRNKKLSYIRFDYQGCGSSQGDLKELTLTDWKGDVLSVLDQLTTGPQILVGSSMGGLLMLHAALERPERIHALVGIASAVDFPQRSFRNYPKQVREEIKEKGFTTFQSPGDDFAFVLTQKLEDDLPNHDIMRKDELEINCPVRLLHGMQDEVIHYSQSIKLVNKLKTNDVEVLYRKAGDHRFSQPEDIQLLFKTLDSLISGMNKI